MNQVCGWWLCRKNAFRANHIITMEGIRCDATDLRMQQHDNIHVRQSCAQHKIMARLVNNMQIGKAIGEEFDNQVLPHQAGTTGDNNFNVLTGPHLDSSM